MNDRSRWTWVVLVTAIAALAAAWLGADPEVAPSPIVAKPIG